MSNVAIISEDVLLGRDKICPDCANEVEYIISETNSEYSHCKICNYNSKTVRKHILFDKILNKIQNYVCNVRIYNISELIIYINIYNEYINVYINDEIIAKEQALFNLNNKEILIFKNTIEDLIEDNFDEGSLKSSVSISM